MAVICRQLSQTAQATSIISNAVNIMILKLALILNRKFLSRFSMRVFVSNFVVWMKTDMNNQMGEALIYTRNPFHKRPMS